VLPQRCWYIPIPPLVSTPIGPVWAPPGTVAVMIVRTIHGRKAVENGLHPGGSQSIDCSGIVDPTVCGDPVEAAVRSLSGA
jgi:hypothetical protein